MRLDFEMLKKSKIGFILIIIFIILNPFFINLFFEGPEYIEPRTFFVFLLLLSSMIFFVGLYVILQTLYTMSFFKKDKELLLLIITLLLVFTIIEFGLKAYLFNYQGKDFLKLKIPSYYSDYYQNDYWNYAYLWKKDWIINQTKKDINLNTNKFYDNWSISLRPDSLLGYSRVPNVAIQGHETSNLGTRSIKKYKTDSPKILFYGDSMVESNAFSFNTLPAKIEHKLGIDCLNYGVGGYGLDQIYLLFDKTYKKFINYPSVFLIGVIRDDLTRMVLEVRTSPKPYFSVNNNGDLILHTEHIDQNNLNNYYNEYKFKLKIYLVELVVRKINYFNKLFTSSKWVKEKITILTSPLLDKFKEKKLNLIFVLFDDSRLIDFKNVLRAKEIPYIALETEAIKYFKSNKKPYPLFVDDHPSSDLNDIFADIISNYLKNNWDYLVNINKGKVIHRRPTTASAKIEHK